MCTVTYLPLLNDDFILTSNRDETPLRKTRPPQSYTENGVVLTYPKDEMAGGTWIGTSEHQRAVCLLNGGFVKHQRQQPYKMSRGLIVKHLLLVTHAKAYIDYSDFEGIEPFTVILIDWSSALVAYELVWDGTTKHFKELPKEPHIWSSSPLYDSKMKSQRTSWFHDWLKAHPKYSKKAILEFHQNDEQGTPDCAIKMKRRFIETVSITCIEKKGNTTQFDYLSLQ